jgi:hypothetical protein
LENFLSFVTLHHILNGTEDLMDYTAKIKVLKSEKRQQMDFEVKE